MALDSFTSGEEEQDDGTDPSGTHVYFYERGHDRLPGEEGDDVYEALAEAYELAKTEPSAGTVRHAADSGYEGGLVHLLAEFVITMGDCAENQSMYPLVDFALRDHGPEESAQMIAQYLDNNEEVADLIVQRIQSTQAAQAESDD